MCTLCLYDQHNGHRVLPLTVVLRQLQKAKAKCGLLQAEVEAERQKILQRRRVQQEKVVQAFDDLQQTIDLKKQELLEQFTM